MAKCRKCNGSNIKSRTNYTHGRKSKGMTTFACRDCGSTEIETASKDRGRGRRRRR